MILQRNPIEPTRVRGIYPRYIVFLLYHLLSIFCILGLCGCKDTNTKTTFDFNAIDLSGTDGYSVVQCYPGKYVYDITVPDTWQGLPVLSIESEAFDDRIIHSIDVGCVETISPRSFAYCTELRTVSLRNVVSIGHDAFESCLRIENITIPKTVSDIGDRAFLACESLKTVYFEGNPICLGVELFSNGVHIFGPAGGNVEKYARDNGLLFTAI